MDSSLSLVAFSAELDVVFENFRIAKFRWFLFVDNVLNWKLLSNLFGQAYGMSISKVESIFKLAKRSHVNEFLVLISDPGVSSDRERGSVHGCVEGKSHLVSERERVSSTKSTPADCVFGNERLNIRQTESENKIAY